MKKLGLLLASAAILLVSNVQAQTIDEVVDKHVAARGGAEKLTGIKTLVIENSMSVQGMEIPMKQSIISGKGLKMEISVMGNDMITSVFDGKGWNIRPAMMGGSGEPEDLPEDEIKKNSNQIDPTGPFLNYKDKGNALTLVGKEKTDGKDAFHVKVTSKDGAIVSYFLDATTYLINKQVATIKSPDGSEATQEMSFSDYKAVDGIQFAHTMETSNPMGGDMTITTTKVTVNGPVDEKIFAKPAK